jgi:hypothetical protein
VIENMSFGGGYTATGSTPSCLQLGAQNGGVVAIRVDRVRVEACTSAAAAPAPAASLTPGNGLIVRNSLFAGNDTGASPALTVSAQGSVGYVLNNTIANNVSANVNGYAGLAASTGAGGSLTLANNLFDGNVATAAARRDVRVVGGVTLLNNRYTGLSGFPLSETGSSSGSAGFGDNDYELAASSTARDAGAFFAPVLQGNFDLYGRPRVQGAAIDLGAGEYVPLLSDGFE